MAQVFEIPTIAAPQMLAIMLGGVQYRLTLRWNVTADVWVLDIADANGAPILSGIAIVTGVNMLDQYDYLNFGGGLYAATDHNADIPPTFTNLGSTGHIYWLTP